MEWKNIGLLNIKEKTPENFTTDFGIENRKKLHPAFISIVKKFMKKDVQIDSFPILDEDQAYIFVMSHSFDDDINTALSIVDKSSYILLGTTDQIMHNPKMYMAWLKGMIYVDRFDTKSREDSLKKMERVLNKGSSIIIFPEGGLNNSENKLCGDLFSSPYILEKKTGCKIVPVTMFNDYSSNDIHIIGEEPMSLLDYAEKAKSDIIEKLNFEFVMDEEMKIIENELEDISSFNSKYDILLAKKQRLEEEGIKYVINERAKKESLTYLRDILGLNMLELMKKYGEPLKRDELDAYYRIDFLEQRRHQFVVGTKWSTDVWDEELTVYKDKRNPSPVDVWSSLDRVNLTNENINIIAPILPLVEEYRKYDFINYMHENWDKPADEETFKEIKTKLKTKGVK